MRKLMPLFVLIGLCMPSMAGAQESPKVAAFAGASLGGGQIPAVFVDGCLSESQFGSTASNGSVGFAVGVEVGQFSLTSHSRLHPDAQPGGRHQCVSVDPVHQTGTHEDLLTGLEDGALVATDMQLGYQTPTKYPVRVSAGGGWVWSHAVPFISGSIGVRTPGTVQFSLDVVSDRYRIPFKRVVRLWEDGVAVGEKSSSQEHHWHGGWALRFGATWTISPFAEASPQNR